MDFRSISRILGNTLAAFATVAIAINVAGTPQELKIAFYAAFMTAMLAFAKELQLEGQTPEQQNTCPTTLTKVLLF